MVSRLQRCGRKRCSDVKIKQKFEKLEKKGKKKEINKKKVK